jgi:predicted RND superfamily exporter protein
VLFQLLAEWFVAHRRGLALGVAAATIAALVGLVRLPYDDVPRTMFRSHDADFERLEEVFEQFGADDVDCVFLIESDDLFQPERVAALRRLIEQIRAVPGIAGVQSLADVQSFPRRTIPRAFQRLFRAVPPQPFALLPALGPEGELPTREACDAAKTAALEHPLIRGQLLSDDARATLVVAHLAAENAPIAVMAPIVERLQATAREIGAEAGLQIRLTGMAPIRTEIFQSVRNESARFVLVGGTLAVLMATLMFRRPAAVAIVCLASLLGAVWTVGMMGLVGEKMNVITTVLPTLVLVIGFTDAVHLMIDIRRERVEGRSPLAASADALKHLGLACLLCSLTTAVGFGSLALARIEVIQRFGVICGVGAVLALIAVLAVVPLLSSTRWGLWVHSRAEADLPERIAAALEPLTVWIVDHARWMTAVGVVVTGLLTLSMFNLVPSNQATEALSASSDAFTAVAEIDRKFGGSSSAIVLVEWDQMHAHDSAQVLNALDAVEQLCNDHPEVRNPTSLVNLVRAVPGEGLSLAERATWLKWVPESTLNHYVRPDLQRALVRMRLHDVGSDVHTATFDDLRLGLAKLEGEHPGLHFHLTGTSVVAARNLNQMITDLASSLGSAAAVIFVVMACGFRSLRLGLISIVPNLFPMAVTAAFLVATGRPLQMTSVIVFSICLGIAVDDTIHFINRFQRELPRDGDVRAAILRSYRAVGSAMIMTSAVLVVGFGSLQISEMPTTRLFSGLSCLTILAALVGDLVILPAMLRVFVPDRRPLKCERPQELAAA